MRLQVELSVTIQHESLSWVFYDLRSEDIDWVWMGEKKRRASEGRDLAAAQPFK
jgi:hypothetical protein